jgi:osmoprotectant transport system substrate-binding protein
VAATAVSLASALAVGGCATDPHAPGTPEPLPAVVVGSGDTAPDELVARFYAGALARIGTHVTAKLDLGDTSAALHALDTDAVTLVPGFTGELARHYDPEAAQTTPDELKAQVSGSLPEGESISDPSQTTDWRASVVVTDAVVARFGAHSLRDLAPHCGDLVLGVPTGTVLPASLRTDYHCDFAQVRQYPPDRLPAALRTGAVHAALLAPAVDPGAGTTALTDEDYAFPAQNPVPVYRTGSLSDAQVKTLNRVAGELETADLAAMVRDLAAHRRSADEIAHSWLDLHGF